MNKLLLLSIIIATMAIPMSLARDRNPLRALKKVRTRMAVFLVLYIPALAYIFIRLPQ